ncbi:uncharacterized protein NECHADRAFT_87151 [Fusarium vanettenii 77-13-4]|uniref:F-box domain-containing protein n=1 Tax=Fusarium vanettenii (strain ATCC MYA-4622 / CBS 123669 / FGSC 9596 / NRRL 45880 / 77-13-4) TaxID=660122 RepID=C7ZII0_FUSV7|nr:uncharacterized protein NECHADRAFT_87151 [Fusarium vanettenii 77-13-4]EEU36266.1 hypothetical protein NECHADRAFT_87151 [Fusarium vanettenii 77-13-4]
MVNGEVYCALCGTLTYFNPASGRPGVAYGNHNASYRLLASPARTLWWLRETSILTENLGGVGIALMEQARYLGNGLYAYDVRHMGTIKQHAYNNQTDFPVAFPVHDVCMSLFQKMLEPEEFDLECVYKTFKKFAGSAPSRCLNLDYGGAERFMGEYWRVVEGEEHYLVSPSSDRALRRWYAILQNEPPEMNGENQVVKRLPSLRDDPFVKLPPELVLLTAEHMTMADFCQWRAASRRTNLLPLENKNWRTRLIRDMPWMFDVSYPEISDSPVDWEDVYKTLHLASFSRGDHRSPALINRKRIWQICLPLVKAFHEEKAIQNKEEEAIPETMIDAVVDTEPKPNYKTCRELLFLRRFSDLDSVHPKIVVEWTRNLEFKAIKAGNCGFVYKKSMGLDLEDQVFFPEDGWLAGISVRIYHDQPDDDEEDDIIPSQTVITGISFSFSQTPVGGHGDFGDPVFHATHLLAPRAGHFIVGLKVYDDGQDKVKGIELIQQPLTKLRRPTRRAMVDMVSAEVWNAEDTKEKFWIGIGEEFLDWY